MWEAAWDYFIRLLFAIAAFLVRWWMIFRQPTGERGVESME